MANTTHVTLQPAGYNRPALSSLIADAPSALGECVSMEMNWVWGEDHPPYTQLSVYLPSTAAAVPVLHDCYLQNRPVLVRVYMPEREQVLGAPVLMRAVVSSIRYDTTTVVVVLHAPSGPYPLQQPAVGAA